MLARYMLEQSRLASRNLPCLFADLLRSFQEPGSDPLTQVFGPHPSRYIPRPPHFSEPRTRVINRNSCRQKRPNSSALFLDVRRNKTRECSRYFANQARHFANRSASHALCCASSLVNYWPPRIVCPPSPFLPIPATRSANLMCYFATLENHSPSFPFCNNSHKSRSSFIALYFPAPGDCKLQATRESRPRWSPLACMSPRVVDAEHMTFHPLFDPSI